MNMCLVYSFISNRSDKIHFKFSIANLALQNKKNAKFKICNERGFTLVEVLVAMIIVVGSTIFLLKTIMSTQKAIIFSRHKQESVFLLEERIEKIKNIEWATATTTGTETIQDKDINWQIGGVMERRIGPIEFFIIPGTLTGTGTAIGRPSIESGTLDVRENEIFGGTFTVSCEWIEDNNKWATTTYTVYISTNKAFFEESENFEEE